MVAGGRRRATPASGARGQWVESREEVTGLLLVRGIGVGSSDFERGRSSPPTRQWRRRRRQALARARRAMRVWRGGCACSGRQGEAAGRAGVASRAVGWGRRRTRPWVVTAGRGEPSLVRTCRPPCTIARAPCRTPLAVRRAGEERRGRRGEGWPTCSE